MTFKLSTLSQMRLRTFKAHTRGYYSFILVICFGFIAFSAQFIANDKPLCVFYDQRFYFPIFKMYPETTYGGDFATETDYKDAHLQSLIQAKGWMIWPPIKYSYHTVNYTLNRPAPTPPTFENWLGTDDQGRDVLARLLYGLRTSILFGLLLTIISSSLGILAGSIQGYLGGSVDLICQRLIEIWSGLPMLFLLIILSSLITPSFWWLLGLMVLCHWTSLVGVVRTEFLRARNLEYVKAARALGTGNFKIITKHILPNALTAIITYLPFVMSSSIITLTSLDFLGFGLPPGSASLGEMLAQGKNNLHAPWLGLTAFVAISVLLTLLVFIGEAVRHAFDVRKSAL